MWASRMQDTSCSDTISPRSQAVISCVFTSLCFLIPDIYFPHSQFHQAPVFTVWIGHETDLWGRMWIIWQTAVLQWPPFVCFISTQKKGDASPVLRMRDQFCPHFLQDVCVLISSCRAFTGVHLNLCFYIWHQFVACALSCNTLGCININGKIFYVY